MSKLPGDFNDVINDVVIGPHLSFQFQGQTYETVAWLRDRPALDNPQVTVYSHMDLRCFDVKTYLMLFGKKK